MVEKGNYWVQGIVDQYGYYQWQQNWLCLVDEVECGDFGQNNQSYVLNVDGFDQIGIWC